MTTWQGAWSLARYELRQNIVGLLVTVVFFTYLALVMMPLSNHLLTDDVPEVTWLIDFFYFTILPNLGFVMNRTVFSYWRNNPFSKKLALWRTMPISIRQIVLGRLLQLMITIIITWLYYFSLQYVLYTGYQAQLSISEYAGFALFWLGYAVCMSATYVCWELGVNGRTYFIACWCYIVFYGVVTFIVYASGLRAVESVMAAMKHGQWWLPLLSLALAAGTLGLVYPILVRRLRQRSLLS